jgi:hypothetical protein
VGWADVRRAAHTGHVVLPNRRRDRRRRFISHSELVDALPAAEIAAEDHRRLYKAVAALDDLSRWPSASSQAQMTWLPDEASAQAWGALFALER